MNLRHASPTIALTLALTIWGTPSLAQQFPSSQSFPADGESVTVIFTGAPKEFTIPAATPPGLIRIRMKGRDGGNATVPVDCDAKSGGKGAELVATFPVGEDAGELRPDGPRPARELPGARRKHHPTRLKSTLSNAIDVAIAGWTPGS